MEMCLHFLISNINKVVCSIVDTVVSGRDSRDESYSLCPQRDQTNIGGGKGVEDRHVNVLSSDLQRVLLLYLNH